MRAVVLGITLLVATMVFAAEPRTGLVGGGGGDFTNSAGYNYPATPAECIAVGDEAVPADKDFLSCPNTAVWSTAGYDAPTALPKWNTASLNVSGVIVAAANDRAITRSGGWQTLSGTGSGQAVAGLAVNSTHDLRVANYHFRVLTVAGVAANDSIKIELWGCITADIGAPTYPNCDDLGTVAWLCGSGVGGCTETVANREFAGDFAYTKDKDDVGFYNFLLIGPKGTDNVDPGADFAVNAVGYIEYEN